VVNGGRTRHACSLSICAVGTEKSEDVNFGEIFKVVIVNELLSHREF
jgi:hypothetical protein